MKVGMKIRKCGFRKSLIMAVLFAVLLGNLCYWGIQKRGFYCDEMYSYHFVCQVDYPGINGDREGEAYLNNWHTSDYFMDYLTIGPGEAFDFAGVCRSISEDVHPPVYYLLLETVCSVVGFLLPGAFTKWCGIGLNIIFFVLTVFVLFRLARKIFHSDFWAALTCMLYGMSVGAVTTVMFLRMYMIFTFTCVLFVRLNYEFFKQLWTGEKRRRVLLFSGLLAVTVFGILNHYYFFLFAFFTCLFLWSYALMKKEFLFSIQYAAVMGAGIGVSYLLWPYMREDIFSGYRGVEAFNNLTAENGYQESILAFFGLLREELLGLGTMIAVLLLLGGIVFICASLFWKMEAGISAEGIRWNFERKEKRNKGSFLLRAEDLYLIQIALAAGFYLALVAKIAPYQEDRYILNIYPMAVLVTVWAVERVFGRLLRKACGKRILAAVCVCIVWTGYLSPGVNYLYEDSGKKLEEADRHAHLPVFYVTKDNNRYRAAGDSYFLARANDVYPIREEGISSVREALETLEKEEGENYSQFFVYVDLAFEDVDVILDEIERELGAHSARKLFETEYTGVWLVE